MSQRLLLYSDGGARGNPGPAAIAFVALDQDARLLKIGSKFIGVHTNNQAEYHALLMALKYAQEIDLKDVVCHLDSELVTKQVKGEYTVKNPELKRLWLQVEELKKCFKSIRFVSVPRENPQIQKADALVNEALDVHYANESNRVVSRPDQIQRNGRMNTMFVHASIRTSNMDRSIDFYSRFLGLQIQSRREIRQNNAEIAFLRDIRQEGCTLELTFYRDQKKFVQPIYEERLFDHLGFIVSDLIKTLDSMKKFGVTVTDEPYKISENTTIAFVEDPDGTLIELIEHE
jgi:ribonuclease HI